VATAAFIFINLLELQIMSILVLHAEVIVLEHQLSVIKAEFERLSLFENLLSVDLTDERRKLIGEQMTAQRLVKMASDLYEEVMESR